MWTFILIQPLGADEQSGTFMLFVMLLVVAISSMLGSSVPIAVLALTLPVTIAIAIDFVLRGTNPRLHSGDPRSRPTIHARSKKRHGKSAIVPHR